MDIQQAFLAEHEVLNKELIKIKEQAADLGIRFRVEEINEDEFVLLAVKRNNNNLEIPLKLSQIGMTLEQVPKTELDIIGFLCYILKDGEQQRQIAINFFGVVLASHMQNLWNVVDSFKAKFGQA